MTGTRGQSLEDHLRQAWPSRAWSDSHVVLAVSSGPDSVALLRAVLAVKAGFGGLGKLFVAHFNHALRGTAADADQAWLEALGRRLGVPLVIGRADQQPATAHDRGTQGQSRRSRDARPGDPWQGDGWEAAARNARYQFLGQTAESVGARFVAVGHTADDQVETVLHRILRGTGLDGLAGMPQHRTLTPSVTLVRPLLNVTRGEILQYLADIGQDYRTDETNMDTGPTRNRLRHQLLPTLRASYNSGVDQALLRLAVQAEETQQLIADLAEELAAKCVACEAAAPAASGFTSARVRINCRSLASSPLPVVREVCRIAWQRAEWPMQAMGFEQWHQLGELITTERGGPVNLPGSVRARREDYVLVLESIV